MGRIHAFGRPRGTAALTFVDRFVDTIITRNARDRRSPDGEAVYRGARSRPASIR